VSTSSRTRSPAPEGAPPPLVVLVGPTAVGKTAAAVDLAERLAGEIVSADSRYLYRGMDIGTAKPAPGELRRVPHHLIDVTTPDRPWTLAQFQAAAYATVADIVGRGRVPLLVGGTGQYIRAVTEGWQIPPGQPSTELRAELERNLAEAGLPRLVERLQTVDPESAARIDVRNPRRVIRALEVALATGRSFVAQRRRQAPPYRIVFLGLTRSRLELYGRIDERVAAMFRAGLVQEVERLVAQGYTWDLPAMSALGYAEVGQYLRGECTLAEAEQRIKRHTREFVRRQANWFKLSDPAIRWFTVSGTVLSDMAAYLAEALGGYG
jgi:tRNA dimethylallyltransferase